MAEGLLASQGNAVREKGNFEFSIFWGAADRKSQLKAKNNTYAQI